ncbi:MAG: PH domain-containing protein [Actinobacteria bacterium]|nr:PH domain-containing protein [Actinomycetota bacterium]
MPETVSKRTFQSQSQVVACAAAAVVFSFIGLGGLLSASSLAGKVGAVALCAPMVAVALRYGQARLISTVDGVEVRNPFSRYSLRWTEIERFELGRWRISPGVCLVRLRDGETKPALGVFENSSGFGGGVELVAELNEELRRSGYRAPPEILASQLPGR